jgi:hypothetical protein
MDWRRAPLDMAVEAAPQRALFIRREGETEWRRLQSSVAATDIHRRLAAADPTSSKMKAELYELRFALALALGGRADAYLEFAQAPRAGSCPAADLEAGERDYTEALDIYAKLQAAGTFSSGDMEYVTNARAQLEKIRAARARTRRCYAPSSSSVEQLAPERLALVVAIAIVTFAIVIRPTVRSTPAIVIVVSIGEA